MIFDIVFSVQGYIKQTLEVVHEDYTPEQIVEFLSKGEALTTVQENGDVVLYTKDQDIILAKVVNIHNNLEYEDFEKVEK